MRMRSLLVAAAALTTALCITPSAHADWYRGGPPQGGWRGPGPYGRPYGPGPGQWHPRPYYPQYGYGYGYRPYPAPPPFYLGPPPMLPPRGYMPPPVIYFGY